jgi:Zn-finger nucleic acid-binding protein
MMNCPHCSIALQMTDRQGIEVDYCPKCRGILLDRGELDKLIERTSSRSWDDDDDRRPAHAGPPAYGHPPGHPHYKKKSIWREILDFD